MHYFSSKELKIYLRTAYQRVLSSFVQNSSLVDTCTRDIERLRSNKDERYCFLHDCSSKRELCCLIVCMYITLDARHACGLNGSIDFKVRDVVNFVFTVRMTMRYRNEIDENRLRIIDI